jgi:beta-mannanase
MSNNLLETVRLLEQRAEYLEKEAASLRQELAQVADELAAASPVVARYTIEGETYEITQADVDAARSNLVKPWPDEAVQELALANKMAERLRKLSPEEQNQHFFKTVEAIRAAAIADGTAIETEAEAAIDD